jgi:hypothetical protein
MRISSIMKGGGLLSLTLGGLLPAAAAGVADDPAFPNCKGAPTGLAPLRGEPTTVATVPNGLLQSVGTPTNPLRVAHVYGTAYEMGFASGQLIGSEFAALYHSFLAWVDTQIDPYLKFLPPVVRHAIENAGVAAGLDMTALITKKYTPARFLDEIRGFSEGAGVEYGMVLRLAMFPELVKASCSIMGAWGPATADGKLLGLRALDWGFRNPLRNVPLVTVYHPNEGDGHPFAQLGWTGMIGALTGFSGHDAICEKVWYHYDGHSSREGIPWTFLLRDILQYDTDIASAVARIDSAHRTCSIFVGLGSGTDGEFRVIEYSDSQRVDVFNDTSPFPGYAPTPPEHPLFPGVTYVDKHTQPSHDPCMASIIANMHGNMTAPAIVELVGRFQTGDLHAAVYDWGKMEMTVGVATQGGAWPAKDPSTVQPAYDRQFITLDMAALFAEKKP